MVHVGILQNETWASVRRWSAEAAGLAGRVRHRDQSRRALAGDDPVKAAHVTAAKPQQVRFGRVPSATTVLPRIA
ncbi:hypothetical protein CQ12_15180 [Bradyrhizobium jicamae]|uniref:Uncharacterized protein n=1 Tax=Bradyrhizobium jicamae TaxID=280332 RepID=A0A0R3L216_9BRAD|nr:hypothetical protein CQ12_15180 [Bradyrhizobium jicamae]